MQSDSEVSLEYQISRSDVIANMFRLILPNLFRVFLVIIAIAGIVLIVIGENWWAGLGALIFPFVFVLVYWRFAIWMVKEHPEMLEKQSLSFNDERIRISNSVTRIAWPWSRIRSVADKGEFLLLRFDSLGSGAVIPRNALTEEQLAALLSHIERNRAAKA